MKSDCHKKASKMEIRYDSYCGLNCGACPVGIANELGDLEGIRKMAGEWGRDPDDLRCGGCKTDLTAVFCTDCGMRVCAMEKKLEFCSECDDFPCGKITKFRNDDAPHHSAVFSNLAKIREMGLENWLDAEAARWSCPECGNRFGWYSKTCDQCGKELYNAVSEEEELRV